MNKYFLLILIVCLFIAGASAGQQTAVNPKLLNSPWPSAWITCPDVPQREYGVYHFRKTITLDKAPEKFIVHISADNRYRLFVNGTPVCSGPARGDLYNWYFESVDIASYFHKGKNVIAALVWNMGVLAPVAQISNQTAFVMQGDGDKEQIVNTNGSWKVLHDSAYQPCSLDNGPRLNAYMVIGPGDKVDGTLFPWGWEKTNYDDQEWKSAVPVTGAIPLGSGSDNLWTLVPRNIPLMDESLQRFEKVRRSGSFHVPEPFLKGQQPLVIPANQKVSILFDQAFNTTAYPELNVSGGKGASVKISYAEALTDTNRQKGNRNEIDGKELNGNYDIFLPDGGKYRNFRPLWFRAYRFVQLDITTAGEPLILNDFYGTYTGYPFKQKAAFSSSDPSLEQLWNVGWRTARLCAGETYFDCPYYEQLQYEGDTRIQALISLYVTGDDRLMRKAILDFNNSRVPEGLTQGRYPSNRLQVIPPYSLFWVSMIYDYWMHRKDDQFIAQFLPAIDGILNWYDKNTDRTKGMLGPMKWWNFTDYTDVFPNGVPPGADNGNSSVISLHYAYTLNQAAALYDYFGKTSKAELYRKSAKDLSKATYKLCYNPVKKEMADTPEKKSYSQHAGILAILTGTIPEEDKEIVMKRLIGDPSLGQVTFYFRFYLTQALKAAGMADLYYSQLKPWRDMLGMGLTTFAEKPEPARSDCHAWSASPLYDFLSTICGVVPASPGFATVRIAPALGELERASANIPHPYGEISVKLTRKGKTGIKALISLPPGVTGEFIWNDEIVKLKSRSEVITLN